jgi:hypothetical protein
VDQLELATQVVVVAVELVMDLVEMVDQES